MAQGGDRPLFPVELAFTGKLITYDNPITIGATDYSVCQNLRPLTRGLQVINGMEALNGTALTNVNVVDGLYYTKNSPPEHHMIVRAVDGSYLNGKLFVNDNMPGTQGNFNVTPLWTDAAGVVDGQLALSFAETMLYCNGQESLVWSGNETRFSQFLNYGTNNGNDFVYDYTDRLNNSSGSVSNNSPLYGTNTGIDSYTKLLLHFDNNYTDASASAHVVTPSNTSFTTGLFNQALAFDGTNSDLTMAQSSDFSFGASDFTIDFRANFTALSQVNPLWFINSDSSNYMHVYLDYYNRLVLEIVAGGSQQLLLKSNPLTPALTTGTWHHYALVRSGNNWTFYWDGTRVAYYSLTYSVPAWTNGPVIGYDSVLGAWLDGSLDEYRVSSEARWTANFFPLGVSYGNSTDAYCWIASTRPLRGFKFYVSTPNGNSGSDVAVNYFTPSGLTAVTGLVDGTALSGTTLAQTGFVTFDSTVGLAQPSFLPVNSAYAYWYQVIFQNINGAQPPVIYQTTLSQPMQPVNDLWDGVYRQCISCLVSTSATTVNDDTLNVQTDTWVDGDNSTYADITGLSTSGALYFSFIEQQSAFTLHVMSQNVNIAAAQMTVSYWNGMSWIPVGGLVDGTSLGGVTLSQGGVVSWVAPSVLTEQKKFVGQNLGVSVYQYQVTFTNNLLPSSSQLTAFYFIGGITAPVVINPFSVPFTWQNRLGLACEKGRNENRLLLSATSQSVVFNGDGVYDIEVGDESPITAVGSFFTRYGGTMFDSLLICKESSCYLLDGADQASYRLYPVSDIYGCAAPHTLVTASTGYDFSAGMTKHVIIWQAATAVCMFDGNSIMEIDGDIKNFLELDSSDHINPAMLGKSCGFYDNHYNEYHWCFADGTSTVLNREFVYNLGQHKWFEIVRGSGKLAQCGLSAYDSQLNNYSYVGGYDGVVRQLDVGSTMDGLSYTARVRFADKSPLETFSKQSQVRRLGVETA
jgi:hypothetical protein